MPAINRREFIFGAAASVIAMWIASVVAWRQRRAVDVAFLLDDDGNLLTDDSGVALTNG
jgi:LDH2 family malate/lactate/ureidoglycolate dehydrogenase